MPLALVDDAPPREFRLVSDPETAILERLRAGDETALDQLVQRYQRELVGFFYHLCWDQLVAEELAQDVFVNVFRARSRYSPLAKVRTYLYRIAHNLWIDHLRRRRGHLSLDAEMGEDSLRLVDCLAAPESSAADGVGGAETAARAESIRTRVQAALELLPEGQREVFVLANSHGMKYQEIAGVLGIPEGTVKSRMHNAVRTLRDELADLVAP